MTPVQVSELSAVLAGDITDSEDRMALYQSILDDDRQIIAFDPNGDGTIAELHGDIGSDAHSAVFQRRSDAWESTRQVLIGGVAETHRAPTYEVYPSGSPYAPPAMAQDGWGPGGLVDVK